MVGRIVRSADFERVLRRPPCARSGLFAIHHLPAEAAMPELSTVVDDERSPVVDEFAASAFFGSVVPKRFARRAVTRNLVKRQIRAAAVRHAGALPAGLWVVRLKAPLDGARWPS
ncbi:MAG: ribonuclease P protein component, partial [Betaproteobacteria bacterium]